MNKKIQKLVMLFPELILNTGKAMCAGAQAANKPRKVISIQMGAELPLCTRKRE
jgi:hypothetical protein